MIEIEPGDSLSAIVDRVDRKAVTMESLQAENAIASRDSIQAGDYLDICVNNEIDDITGDERHTPTPPPGGGEGTGVVAQQQQLNALFADTGMPQLPVDGDSGSMTQRHLCAARLALGDPASRVDMESGSDEEQRLMSTESLPAPPSAPTSSSRWALIDKTCQVMFVGESDQLAFVFPTSTGEEGYETRDQDASPAFRYDPAHDNDGWHNSSDFPTEADNPLNGNMYKPIYFDRGQAIHGANNVPSSPASKGCARLAVDHQETLVSWLGLSDATSPTGEINLTVRAHGAY